MKVPPPTDEHVPGGGGCREARRSLASLRRRLRRSAACDGASSSSSPAELASVREHLRACARCRRRLGARLVRVEGLVALRKRCVPSGCLDGLYEAVKSRVPLAMPGGGMSSAFLDAPRALRLWRSVAVAASFTLALGAGLLFSGGLGAASGRATPRPLSDPRVVLLEAWERPQATDAPMLRVRPVRHSRGDQRFFGPVVPAAMPAATERIEPAPRWN